MNKLTTALVGMSLAMTAGAASAGSGTGGGSGVSGSGIGGSGVAGTGVDVVANLIVASNPSAHRRYRGLAWSLYRITSGGQ